MHFSLHRKVTLVFLPKFILFSQERKCISKNSPLKLCNLFYYFRSNALTAYLKLLLQINCNKNELFPQKELRFAVISKNSFLVSTNVGHKIQSLIYTSKYHDWTNLLSILKFFLKIQMVNLRKYFCYSVINRNWLKKRKVYACFWSKLNYKSLILIFSSAAR